MNVVALTWIAVCLLISGYILNIRKKSIAWPCWIACSTLWLIYAICTEQYSLVINNLICIAFSFLGWYTWVKEERNNKL